jgi:hypothetical protein
VPDHEIGVPNIAAEPVEDDHGVVVQGHVGDGCGFGGAPALNGEAGGAAEPQVVSVIQTAAGDVEGKVSPVDVDGGIGPSGGVGGGEGEALVFGATDVDGPVVEVVVSGESHAAVPPGHINVQGEVVADGGGDVARDGRAAARPIEDRRLHLQGDFNGVEGSVACLSRRHADGIRAVVEGDEVSRRPRAGQRPRA